MACTAAFTVRMPAASRAVAAPAAARAAAAALRPAAPRLTAPARSSSRPQSARGLRLVPRASWGAPVEFAAGKVLENEREAEQLQRLRVQIGGAASAYTKAGQFIQAKFGEDGKAGFFAIASSPGADKENGVVELLVKSQGGTAEQLCTAAAGAEVLVSAPMGKGFHVDTIPPADVHTVLIFATGSGISPIRALIESGVLQAGERKDVRLYYGVRSPAHQAFADAIPAWQAAGVKVVPVFSGQGQGYVQDAFAKETGVSDWGGVAAVLCGQKGMAEAVTELLTSNGVPPERILTNF
ncbi:hypothetical protein C2E20_5041 [Micractinium conductrix]|uniref:FAD-binding FR-type domain-containing protein n=1 Tax=Micractinium conductrix TaxID=554055 RepID=A0A2P6VBI0_9CHLO|nr:hypothetical protein C2E20_5041 [Micractinium conductrix]|eukprot:PSC71452.1 hypothetical protein C2E20_5041 [Micractinium conductrix]